MFHLRIIVGIVDATLSAFYALGMLPTDKVRALRAEYEAGTKIVDIARRHGLVPSTVSRAVRHKTHESPKTLMGPGARGQRKRPEDVVAPVVIRDKDGTEIVEVEEWKQVHDAPLYFVSSLGRVFSQRTNRLLKPSSQERYSIIVINGKARRVCRLVAMAFVSGQTTERWQVNHKDGQRFNDRASNLEWVSPRENAIHAVKMGISQYRRAAIDVAIVEEIYKDVLWRCKTPYSKEMSDKYGLTGPVMHAVMEGLHHLQQDGLISSPSVWLSANPPPQNSVAGPESMLSTKEVEGWFAQFKEGSSAQAIAKKAKSGVGLAVVARALSGSLVRQRRGELPSPPVDLHEQRRLLPPSRPDASLVAAVVRLRTEERLDLGSIAERLSISHDTVKRINRNEHALQLSGDAPLMPALRKREMPSKQKVTKEVVERVLANAAAGMGLNANCRAVGLGPPTVKKIIRGQHPVQKAPET